MFPSSVTSSCYSTLVFSSEYMETLSVVAVRVNWCCLLIAQWSGNILGLPYPCAYPYINRIKCIRHAIHMHIYLHQQNKSYSIDLGQSYTSACLNRIKCLAGPKGLLVIPCIQGIIGWTKVVNIYNFIKEDLGHQSDQTFRGPWSWNLVYYVCTLWKSGQSGS